MSSDDSYDELTELPGQEPLAEPDKQPDKKRIGPFWFVMIVWFLTIAAALILNFFDRPHLVIPGFFAAVGIHVFVHELGHIIAGLLAGLRLRFFQLWRLVVIYHHHRWHLLTLKLHNMPARGSVAFTASNAKNLTNRMLIAGIGGPAASAILLLATIILIIVGQWWKSSTLIFLASLLVLMTLRTVLIQIFPNKSKSMDTDGQMIRQLLKGGPEAFRYAALHIASVDNASGFYPHAWNTEMLNQAVQGPCRTRQHCVLLDMAYTAALSHQDYDLACEYMDSIQEYLDPDDPKFDPDDLNDRLRYAAYLDIAFFEAYYRNDLDNARRWFDQASEQDRLHKPRARAEAAILLAEGYYQEAIESAEAGKPNLVEEEFISGGRIWTIDELDSLIAEAERLTG